jgi:hypothetical protein
MFLFITKPAKLSKPVLLIGQCNGLQPLAVASPPTATENFVIGSWHPLGCAGKEPVGDFPCQIVLSVLNVLFQYYYIFE